MSWSKLRLISGILSIVLIITLIPTSVYGEIIEGTKAEVGISDTPEPTIIGELTTTRDESTKYFLMTDGTVVAAVYSNAVHYQQPDGQYSEIDNQLIATESPDGTLVYQNAANSYSVTLANKVSQANGFNMFKFKENEYSVNWNIINADTQIPVDQNVTAQVQTTVNDDNNKFSIETKESTLTYKNIIKGVNLEYTPDSNGVKENIILTQRAKDYRYVFLLTLEGLGARLTYDNSIELYDLENPDVVKYFMPAPYMMDSLGEESLDVKYNLRSWQDDKDINDASDTSSNNEDNQNENTSSEKSSSQQEDTSSNIDDTSSDSSEPDPVSSTYESNTSETLLTGTNASDATSSGTTSSDTVSSDVSSSDLASSDASSSDITSSDSSSSQDSSDANNTESANDNDDAEIELAENQYCLSIQASEEWIDNEARVFPITIDPVLKKYRTKKDYSNLGQFQTIRKDKVEQSGNDLIVGKKDGVEYRTYMQFNLPAMQAGVRISEAKLNLSSSMSGSVHNVYVYSSPSQWDESRITWPNQPLYGDNYKNNRVVDYIESSTTATSVYFDITKSIKKWYNNPSANYGLCILSDTTAKSAYSVFQPIKSTSTPYLQITYRSITGLEEYWSTHSSTVGDAGIGEVNDNTGLLTFTHDDVSTAGNRMPVSIQHVYNSNQTNKNTPWGKGWTINCAQTLKIPIEEADLATYPYVYTDGDGTRHYFKKSNVTYYENGAAVNALSSSTTLPSAKDEDGLGLFVVPVTDKTLKTTYPLKIVDKSGNTNLYFDNMGRLGLIADANQKENAANKSSKEKNRIIINYEDIPNQTADFSALQALIDQQSTLLANVKSTEFIIQAQKSLTVITSYSLNDPYIRAKYEAALKIQEAITAIQYLTDNDVKVEKTRTTYVTKAKTALQSALKAISGLDALLNQRIGNIQDAVNNTANFSYDADGKLKSISDPKESDKNIEYSYDNNGNLTVISNAKGDTVHYSYNDGLMTFAEDSDGYGAKYEYSEKSVSKVSEYADGQTGQEYSIDYGEDCTTTFQFSGADDKFGSSDDILNVYTFDKDGKTTSICSKPQNKNEIYGAAVYTYNGGSGDASKKLKESAENGTNTTNLLKNHSFEYTGDWTTYSDCILSDHSASVANTTQKYIGKRSAAIVGSKSTHTGQTGYVQTLDLAAGDYTFSGYIMASSLTGNAYISIQNGEVITYSEKITGTTDTGVNNGWIRVSLTFNLSEPSMVKARFGTDGGTGSAWFDCLQLETGTVSNQYNILENSSFEIGNLTDAPYQWTYTQKGTTTKGAVTADTSVQGSRSYKIVGDPKNAKTLSISPAITGSASYVLSGWVKTNCAPIRSGRTYSLAITATNLSGITVPLNPFSDGWTYFSVSMPTAAWESTTIKFTFSCIVGDLYIDNLQLVKNEVQTRGYNSTGKLTSYSGKSATTTYTYSGKDLPLTQKTPGGNTTTYTYDGTTNDVTKASLSTGPDSFYTYDKYGKVISQTVKDEGNTATTAPEYYTATTYTEDGNFLVSAKDTRGNVTQYENDTTKGLRLSKTNAAGIKTEYTHNSEDLVSSVSQAGITNSYTYDTQNRLSEIQHNGFNYSFDYDSWGNKLSTAVAGKPIIDYTYAARNGKLLETTYANGFKASPIYDEKEQIIGHKRNGVTVDKLTYNNAGNLVDYFDYSNSLRYNYDYDTTGRALRQYVEELGTRKPLYQFQNVYDSAGRIAAVNYGFGNDKKNYKFSYGSDDKVSNVTLPNSGTISYTYDGLRRLTKMVLVPVSGAPTSNRLIVSYSYVNGIGSTAKKVGATTLVRSYTNEIDASYAGNEYYTDYDVLGNIIITGEINCGSSYEYDALNQLTSYRDVHTNIWTDYAYDQGGNISKVSEYEYIFGPESLEMSGFIEMKGRLLNTHSYRYENEWADLLTSYDGQEITYDAIGNPTSYLGATLTWQNGRELAAIHKDNTDIHYTYTIDGNRLSKTVNGTKTEYKLNGSMILSETTGNETLYYYYDSDGKLIEIGYKNGSASEVYYFVTRNMQGDIMAIYDAKTCTLVGSYSYDAWGKLLEAKPEKDSDGITEKNPFRYRGYYYDNETGYYYLQSRYYDPQIGRFINADNVNILLKNQQNILEHNLFAYCVNNPIKMTDPHGYMFVADDVAYLYLFGIITLAMLNFIISLTNYSVSLPSFAENKSDSKESDKKEKNDLDKDEKDRKFREALDDINKNPGNWQKTGESTDDSTNVRYKGGKSIEEEYTNSNTGETIYKHTLRDSRGKTIEEHYRPDAKQIE